VYCGAQVEVKQKVAQVPNPAGCTTLVSLTRQCNVRAFIRQLTSFDAVKRVLALRGCASLLCQFRLCATGALCSRLRNRACASRRPNEQLKYDGLGPSCFLCIRVRVNHSYKENANARTCVDGPTSRRFNRILRSSARVEGALILHVHRLVASAFTDLAKPDGHDASPFVQRPAWGGPGLQAESLRLRSGPEGHHSL
jgi:hypothetical protein